MNSIQITGRIIDYFKPNMIVKEIYDAYYLMTSGYDYYIRFEIFTSRGRYIFSYRPSLDYFVFNAVRFEHLLGLYEYITGRRYR
jgi:hypothetical protein